MFEPAPKIDKPADFAACAPADFASLRLEVLARKPHLPRRLTQVASFALDHPDDMAFGTVATIAKAADVQPSTLVRFAQTLGYQGFSELQMIFRTRLKERMTNYDDRIQQLRQHTTASATTSQVVRGVIKAVHHSLARVEENLNDDDLKKAIDLLHKADTLYLIGHRRSYPLVSYMAYLLSTLHIKNRMIDSQAGLGHEVLQFARPQDAIIAISFAPYASETLQLVEQAAKAQVPLLAITDSSFSPLVPLAHHWFEITETAFEGFRPLAASMALTMGLCLALGEKRAR